MGIDSPVSNPQLTTNDISAGTPQRLFWHKPLHSPSTNSEPEANRKAVVQTDARDLKSHKSPRRQISERTCQVQYASQSAGVDATVIVITATCTNLLLPSLASLSHAPRQVFPRLRSILSHLRLYEVNDGLSVPEESSDQAACVREKQKDSGAQLGVTKAVYNSP